MTEKTKQAWRDGQPEENYGPHVSPNGTWIGPQAGYANPRVKPRPNGWYAREYETDKAVMLIMWGIVLLPLIYQGLSTSGKYLLIFKNPLWNHPDFAAGPVGALIFSAILYLLLSIIRSGYRWAKDQEIETAYRREITETFAEWFPALSEDDIMALYEHLDDKRIIPSQNVLPAFAKETERKQGWETALLDPYLDPLDPFDDEEDDNEHEPY